jgi:hypothetical protein
MNRTCFLVMLCGMMLLRVPRSAAALEGANGEQWLLPESGILFEPGPRYQYQELLRQLFLEKRPAKSECQMIVESGFGGREHEEAVLIERDKDGQHPTAVHISTTVNLSNALMKALAERDRHGDWQAALSSLAATISEQRAPLTNETADMLSEMCEMMLGTVRYPRRALHPMDGGEVHFAHFDSEHGYRGGKANAERGRVAAYVRVLEQLGRVATARPADRDVEEMRARNLAAALIEGLRSAGLPVPDIHRERNSGSAVLPLPRGWKSDAIQ